MSFKENINRICKEQGTTLTALVKSMGLSTSKVSRWNERAVYRAPSRRNKHEFMSMVYEFEARKELEGDSGNSAAV